MIIKSQDKTIGNLRDVMKRQPGISEAEMITQYQETVKEKGNQLKVTYFFGNKKRLLKVS